MGRMHVTPPTYQLKITLREIEPEIWRRILVPGDIALAKLHSVIQVAMGWSNSHLHSFDISGVKYGMPNPELEIVDHRRVALARAARNANQFVYEYDFGDCWKHDVVVEKVYARPTGHKLPALVDGERACPCEDSGGCPGYADLLEALADPTHEDHERLRGWAGDDFDPETFDRVRIAKELHAVARKSRPRTRRAAPHAAP